MTRTPASGRLRPLEDTKDTDRSMTSSHRPRPLHCVLPGRSLLLLVVLLVLLIGLTATAFRM